MPEILDENRDVVRFRILTYLLANAGQDKTVTDFIKKMGFGNSRAIKRKVQRAFQDLVEQLTPEYGLQRAMQGNTAKYRIDKNAELYRAFQKVKPETVLQLLKQRLSYTQVFEINPAQHKWLASLDSLLARIYIAPDTQLLPAIEDEEVVASVYQSLAEQKYLQLSYENSVGKTSELLFLPWGLMFKGLSTYVVGRKKGERTHRLLALYRIKHANLTQQAGVLSDLFSENQGFQAFCEQQGFAVFALPTDQKIEVNLRFFKSAGHLAQMKLANNQKLIRITGASCRRQSTDPDYFELEVVANVLIGRKFKEWLRSFGAEVEVISPESLRQEMISELHKTLANYQ
ncbi:MAG: WYL domain-containing protein [Alishewanella agri]|nr:WYL domain-containing protein [Alishewanella agri]